MAAKNNPWHPHDKAMLGVDVDKVVGAVIGRSPWAVAKKREREGVAAAQKQSPWTPEQVAMLGQMTDKEVGAATGRNTMAVYTARRARGIAAFNNLTHSHGGGKPSHKK